MQFLRYAVHTYCFLAELDAKRSSDYFEEADDEYGSGSMGEEVGQHYMACWENFNWDEDDTLFGVMRLAFGTRWNNIYLTRTDDHGSVFAGEIVYSDTQPNHREIQTAGFRMIRETVFGNYWGRQSDMLLCCAFVGVHWKTIVSQLSRWVVTCCHTR